MERGSLPARHEGSIRPVRTVSAPARTRVCTIGCAESVGPRETTRSDNAYTGLRANPTAMPRARRSRHHHHVYVVQLSDEVWNEPGFRKANPDYQHGKPFVYVGMTGLDPDLRFDRHMAGVQAKRYGLRLMPELFEVYNPMPYEAAREMEVELAIGLRQSGYAVWQA